MRDLEYDAWFEKWQKALSSAERMDCKMAHTFTTHQRLTLLDEIAIEAMNSLISQGTRGIDHLVDVGKQSYDIAESMLKEKAKREGKA